MFAASAPDMRTTQLIGQRHFGQANLDLRLFLAAAGQEGRQPGIDCAVGHGDAKASAQARSDRPDVLLSLFEDGEHPAHILQERCTRFGQYRASAVALEEHHAQVILKLFDGAGQGWLFDMQALCGPCEVQLFCESHKAAKVSQFHGPCSCSVSAIYSHQLSSAVTCWMHVQSTSLLARCAGLKRLPVHAGSLICISKMVIIMQLTSEST